MLLKMVVKVVLLLILIAGLVRSNAGDLTEYICCAKLSRSITLVFNGNTITNLESWNISESAIVNSTCLQIEIPNLQRYNGIIVVCYQQENITFEVERNSTHNGFALPVTPFAGTDRTLETDPTIPTEETEAVLRLGRNDSDDLTKYTCCAKLSRSITLLLNGDEITNLQSWNISKPAVVNSTCIDIEIPNVQRYNGITIVCYQQENITFEVERYLTHNGFTPPVTTTSSNRFTDPKVETEVSVLSKTVQVLLGVVTCIFGIAVSTVALLCVLGYLRKKSKKTANIEIAPRQDNAILQMRAETVERTPEQLTAEEEAHPTKQPSEIVVNYKRTQRRQSFSREGDGSKPERPVKLPLANRAHTFNMEELQLNDELTSSVSTQESKANSKSEVAMPSPPPKSPLKEDQTYQFPAPPSQTGNNSSMPVTFNNGVLVPSEK